ncbi:hypothetical protein HLRTI_000509 [Halorhabdus tiamatea SARL4B]|uniref:Uncharacterized protein n=1 Tax=Halorhabdus tiamatea SARL4B TaxID=1033806 RepID=F7PLR3_9EURY|nr:hypothetical protein [Halorhabdus tiamatea]ERJ07466.1 hypothetical protein HLRTI_000509 [Halorhabdus tiamatea SARL4B]
MPIAGIYTPSKSLRDTEPEDNTFQRDAAFDTDRGAWIETSDGEIVAEFGEDELKGADIEEVLDIFYSRYAGGGHSYYVSQESDIPGEIEVRDPVLDPDAVIDVDTVEQIDK